jgi:NADH-quinone oxidoreductase subunit G
VDICPVGALTSTDFRFKMRVWFLKETPSIDMESSVGCNTVVGSREGTIYRVTPRRNDAVNDTWVPDSGRELYKMVDADDRLDNYAIEGRPVKAKEAISVAAGKLLEEGGVAIVASGRLSVEEHYLLTLIRNELDGPVPTYLVGRYGEGDGKLLSADRNPNVRGALLTGLVKTLPETQLDELVSLINEGSIQTVLTVGEDLVEAGLPLDILKKIKIVYMGTHHSECAQYADVELPILTPFEKSGTFVNQQFRVQKFSQAVPGPSDVLFGMSTFTHLLEALDPNAVVEPSAAAVWEAMQKNIPEFAGLQFESIPATGQLVSDERFSQLPFVEGKGLNFEPKTALAEA